MTKRDQWIDKGYALMAEKGLEGMNVEKLASLMSSSKSSFYHYFGSLDEFRTVLFTYHLQKAGELSEKIKTCQNLIPELLDVFIDNKVDILFHKQIRIFRDNKEYRACFEKAYGIIEDSILEKWISHLELEQYTIFARSLLNLVSDNFLLRITHQDFNHGFLINYVKEVSYLTAQMKISNKS